VPLEEKLKEIPTSSGVYLHKDAAGKVIYVGKAKNLRSRVRSYFRARPFDRKTDALVGQISDFEFIVTDNEVEALILEATLVKQYKPRYNVKLQDDKSYPHLKLTINEPFPKVVITRRVQKDGALYFGPFLPASLARRTIDLINRTFQLRTCDIEIDGKAPRPCLEYHIKRCLGPCVKGLCTPEQYQEAVRDVRLLLEGRNRELAETLEGRMLEASDDLRYELAAKYRDLLEKALSKRRGRRVKIEAPQRGEKRDMIDLVEKNAKLAFEQRFRVLKPDMKRVLEELQETLELPHFPARIESFDISHIQGAENVAGMVVCDHGKMNRAEYRKFRIRGVEGANDVASMREVVTRRYRRLLEEGKPLPDLIMIDGGKGQLNGAAEAMRELGLEAIPMVGIVKPPQRHNDVAYLLMKGREDEPIYLDSHSLILRLLQMIRDETHRFAVTYHRKRRELRDFTSELTAIPGVGDKRKGRLLRHFGSIQRISRAGVSELTPFVGRKTAEEIAEHFERQRLLAQQAVPTENADQVPSPRTPLNS
jgi:excinuclease ABC subunit C